MTLVPVQVAESFHLAFLQALATRANLTAWAPKGGGNLRLFHLSDRFSEDIELDTFDIEPWVFQERVDQALTSDLLKRTLGILGSRIEYVNPKERSETKAKWVIGIRHRSETDPVYTQIEVSHRAYPYRDFVKVEPASPAAIAQKVDALRGRDVRQPRDVFDLDVLFRVAADAVVRGDIDEADLRAAVSRVVEVGYAELSAPRRRLLHSRVAAALEASLPDLTEEALFEETSTT